MQKKYLYDVAQNLVNFLIPFIGIAFISYGIWYLLPDLIPLNAFYGSLIIAIAALVLAFFLFHAHFNIYTAYGMGFGGIALLYASLYYAHTNYGLILPGFLFSALTGIALIAGYVAIRFHGRLLAIIGVAMGIFTPSLVLTYLPRFYLAWYFVLFLLIVMLVAYYRRWFELPILAFMGFLLYNPVLFSHTDLEGGKGLLSVYQVLELMGVIFSIYTLIPWLYSLCCPKKRIFEAISFAIGGAYTAAMIHFVINSQLSLVAQLPFFIRYFVSKGAPLMSDVYMYIFIIYGGIYIGLFMLLFLINRQAKVPLGTLAALAIVCAVGFIYTHAQATGLLPTVIRAKKLVEQTIAQVQA